MTRTGPADVGMSACHSTATGRPVLARPGSGESGSGWAECREPAFVGVGFPGSASRKPAYHRLAGRSGRLRSACPPQRSQRARAVRPWHPQCRRQPALMHPLYLYLLGWHAASVYEWSFDPGRDILCILISPPRRLQWP
jgi:hypothetical protein